MLSDTNRRQLSHQQPSLITYLMLKLFLIFNFVSPSGVGIVLLFLFLPLEPLSSSISRHDSTPIHKLTSATRSWATTAVKNSACLSVGVGGVRGVKDVIMSLLVVMSKVTNRR